MAATPVFATMLASMGTTPRRASTLSTTKFLVFELSVFAIWAIGVVIIVGGIVVIVRIPIVGIGVVVVGIKVVIIWIRGVRRIRIRWKL